VWEENTEHWYTLLYDNENNLEILLLYLMYLTALICQIILLQLWCCRTRKQVDYAHSDKDFEDDDGKLMKKKPVLMNMDKEEL